MKTLDPVCTPRASVFEAAGKDTIYSIDDLDQIPPETFFAENYVTEGMQTLLSEVFARLEGKSKSAAGTFMLSQSMGGGKTHNLVALGLLAKNPGMREKVMSGFYQPGPLGAVRVVTFSGRKNPQFGIWGEIADQLNKRDVFQKLYSPLQAPSDDDWVALLRGDPMMILLDELPAYFEQARAIPVGNTFLDSLTTRALANLIVAIDSGKLPNVAVVITDLHGTAYAAGSQALSDLQQEVNRQGGYVQIEPVKLNSNELYHILQRRLFESVADDAEIADVAEAFRDQLSKAKAMDITAESPDQLKAEIPASYPFHPDIRDLFATFRENPSYQQTRALIRIMRLVVGQLWKSGGAKQQYLIGAHNIDLHDPEMMSEMRMINGTLENAVAHDIAAEGGSSVAEQIDAANGNTDAEDVCKLIFLASLSQAVSAQLGLDRSDLGAMLASPGRDLEGLRGAIDLLQEGAAGAWYLHTTASGKLFFRNVENLKAKLDTYTKGQLPEQRVAELRSRLGDMFKPVRKDCYQDVAPLPALDQVTLTADRVTLLIFQPKALGLPDDIKDFWEHQNYKNRVIFLSGVQGAYDTVLQRAAQLSASHKIHNELKNENRRPDDPQLVEAEQMTSKCQSAFHSACRESFQTLWYPSNKGLTQVDFDPKYEANNYNGEQQVINELSEVAKFREKTDADSGFKTTLEAKLWPADSKTVKWSVIKQRAAQDPSWTLHHPRALDELKAELLKRDVWRESGEYVERGPFPKPATSVRVQVLHRNNDTGEATLRVTPLNADAVYWSADGPATPSSPRVDTGIDFPTKEMTISFVAVDSTNEHATGDAITWTNTINMKYRFFQDGANRCCELTAIPTGTIRYTTDGSNPGNGQTYKEPFSIPDGAHVILAVATESGVRSDQLKIDVPKSGDGKPGMPDIDPAKPARWKRQHKRDATGDTYEFIDLADKYMAQLGGVKVTASAGSRWVEFLAAQDVLLDAAYLRDEANRLRELVPAGNIDLRVETMQFATGKDLQDMVRDLKMTLTPEEVAQ